MYLVNYKQSGASGNAISCQMMWFTRHSQRVTQVFTSFDPQITSQYLEHDKLNEFLVNA